MDNDSVQHKQCLSNCAEIALGTKISEGTKKPKPPDIGSPLAFSVNDTLSINVKCQNHSFLWDFRN